LRIQPQEGIDISFDVKEPSSPQTMRSAKLSFEYEEFFEHPTPDAYQRLLQDVILGDQSLFIRSDEVEACWVWADSLRNMMNSQPLYNYETGSWGPDISNTLFGDEAFSWIVSVN
jgi:glucose-6-phosphate 1-dehydrogenase